METRTTIERLKARKWLWVTILGLLAIGLSFGLRTLWRDFSPSAEFMSPGTVLSVRVDETLTSSNASPGDVFEARVVSARAVKGSAVPSLGVQAEGRCLAVRRGAGDDRPGYLRLALTGLRDSEGRLTQIQSSAISQWGSTEFPTLALALRAAVEADRRSTRAKPREQLSPTPEEAVVTPGTTLNFVVLDPVAVGTRPVP